MTKEELEKEAIMRVDAFIDNFVQDIRSTLYDRLNQENVKDFLYSLYFDSAEPREKQIEIDAKQIRALQKQNGELTDELKALRESIKDYGAGCYENGLRNGRRKLEQQIEKMKCCGNCKYSNQDGAYTIVCKVGGVDKTHYIEIDDNQVCDKWEIKEK